MEDKESPQSDTDEFLQQYKMVVFFVHRELMRISHRIYVAELIFADDKRRVSVLNEHSETVGALLRELLLDAIVLDFCRLLDAHKTAGNANLSLDWLAHHIDQLSSNAGIVLRERMAEAKAAGMQLLQRRHKWISHNDFNTIFSGNLSDEIPFDVIRNTLSACREVIRAIPDNLLPEFYDAELISPPFHIEEQVLSFLSALHLGNRAYTAHLKRASEQFDSGDFHGHPGSIGKVEDWLCPRRYT